MSALRFHKNQNTTTISDRCCEPDCNAIGRYRFEIAGEPIWTEIPWAARSERSLLCRSCKKKAEALWDELTEVAA